MNKHFLTSQGISRKGSGIDLRHDGKIGVIDIGSNSIRLVVYDGIKRVPVPIYNEKVMCGLGRGLGQSGKLNPEGVKMARECLHRLLTMVRLLGVVELTIIATAALRDAKDGAAFVAELEETHGIRIQVISGGKEAQLAGYGVLANIHAPEGIVGDLGGGSMELVRLEGLQARTQTTLPLGPLRLLDQAKDSAEVRVIVRDALEPLKWLKEGKKDAGNVFYAVGGSFRALAALQMERTNYPLHILHNYRASAEDMRELCESVQRMQPSELQQLGVPGKRAPALPVAAVVLEEVLAAARVREVVFCTSGIREGYLYDHLAPFVRMEDPLIASATDLSRHERLKTDYARDLFTWMSLVFHGETPEEARLRQALCILSELAWHIHPEYRAPYAFQRTLHSAIVGLDHAQRVALGVAMHHRYRYKETLHSPLLDLLSPRQLAWGQSVGVAAHLAFQLSGAMPGNLPLSELSQGKKDIRLSMEETLEGAMDDGIKKRLNVLGERIAHWKTAG